MCEASICSNSCGKCTVLCSSRPGAVPLITSIGGPEITLETNEKIDLTSHIPILPDRFKTPPKYDIMPIIAVHGGNMLSRNGEKINNIYRDKGYAGALNIDKRSRAILEFYVKDRTLEGFWDKRKELYKDLQAMNFQSIIAPNFSVYEDAPRMDHIYNMKRTTIVYNEMLKYGLCVIPDVSWYSKRDLERWCDEINKKNIKAIAFSFQVVNVQLKASSIWKAYILGFRYLCQNIGSDIDIIVAGIASPNRVKEVCRAANGQKIHVLNQSAYIQSRRAMISEQRRRDAESSMDDLFERNVVYFNNVYDELNNLYRR